MSPARPKTCTPPSTGWAPACSSTASCSRRPADWRAALAEARRWTPPSLPISGADALALGLKPGPQVGALLEAVERWWIAGDFSADRAACLAELKRLAGTT